MGYLQCGRAADGELDGSANWPDDVIADLHEYAEVRSEESKSKCEDEKRDWIGARIDSCHCILGTVSPVQAMV
eukprot:3378020-Rhodomonas_salina.1